MDGLKICVVNKDTLYMFKDLMTNEVRLSFNDLSVSYCAILETDEGPKRAGIIIGHPDGEELYIDWLFVNKELRGRGVAGALLERMSEAVQNVPEFSGIMAFAGEGEEELRRFLDNRGFLVMSMEGRGQFVTKVSECGLNKALADGASKMCFGLDKIPARAFRGLEMDIEKDSSVSVGVPLPIKAEDYSPLSMAFQLRQDQIEAIVLLKEDNVRIFGEEQSVINVSWAYSRDKSGKSLMVLIACILNMIKKEMGDVILTFASLNEKTMNLGRKLFDDAEFEQLYLAYLSFEE